MRSTFVSFFMIAVVALAGGAGLRAANATIEGPEFTQAMQVLGAALKDARSGSHASAKEKEAFFRELVKAEQLLERASDTASKEVDVLEARGWRESPLWSATAELALTCAFAKDSLGLAASKGKEGDWKSAVELVREQATNLRDAKLTVLQEAKKVGV